MYRIIYPTAELSSGSDYDSPVSSTSGVDVDKKLMNIANYIEDVDIYLRASRCYVSETQGNFKALRKYASTAEADLRSAQEGISKSEEKLQAIRLELQALFQNAFNKDSSSSSTTEKSRKNSGSHQGTDVSTGTIPVHVQRSIRKYANANTLDLNRYTVAYDGTESVVMHPSNIESKSPINRASGSVGHRYHQPNACEADVQFTISRDGRERDGFDFKDQADINKGHKKGTRYLQAADQGELANHALRREVLDVFDKIMKAGVSHQTEKRPAAASAYSSCEHSLENNNCASVSGSSESMNETFRNGNVQEKCANISNPTVEPEMCGDGILISDPYARGKENADCFAQAEMHLSELVKEHFGLCGNPASGRGASDTWASNEPNEFPSEEMHPGTHPDGKVDFFGINSGLLNKQTGYTDGDAPVSQGDGGLNKKNSHNSCNSLLTLENELRKSPKQRGKISGDRNSYKLPEEEDVYWFPFTRNETASVIKGTNYLSANLEAQSKRPVKPPLPNYASVIRTPESRKGYLKRSDNENKPTPSRRSGSEELYKSLNDFPEGKSISNFAIRAGPIRGSLTDFVLGNKFPPNVLASGSGQPFAFGSRGNVEPLVFRERNATSRLDHSTNEIPTYEEVDNDANAFDKELVSIRTSDLTPRAMSKEINKLIETRISENRKYLLRLNNSSEIEVAEGFRTKKRLPSTGSNPSCSYANDPFTSNEHIRSNKSVSHSPKLEGIQNKVKTFLHRKNPSRIIVSPGSKYLFGDQALDAENINISGIGSISSPREKTFSSTIPNVSSLNDSSPNMSIKMPSHIIRKNNLTRKDSNCSDRQVFSEKYLCSTSFSSSKTSEGFPPNNESKYLGSSNMLDKKNNRTEYETVSGRSFVGMWNSTDSRSSENESFHAFFLNFRANRSKSEERSLCSSVNYSYSDTNLEPEAGEVIHSREFLSFNSPSSTSGSENMFQYSNSATHCAPADNSMSNACSESTVFPLFTPVKGSSTPKTYPGSSTSRFQ